MKLKLKFSLCGATLVFLYLFIKLWNFDFILVNKSAIEVKKNNIVHHKKVKPEREFTLVLRYSHDTSKHLAGTVNSFLYQFPLISVIIVSDTIIPREVTSSFSNTSKVTNIFLKLDLMHLIVDRNVGKYIKTKYVFIAPVGIISLMPKDVPTLIKVLNQNRSSFVAVPVEKKPFKCLKLELNLLQWTIHYKDNEADLLCDCIQGDHGILTHTATIRKIGEPFLLPYPEAFYIQSTSLNLKVYPTKRIFLKNPHKEVKKNDVVLKNQIQRQLMNKQFKIKKVIRENGVIEWYGCTRNTQRCFPNVINSIPDYINQGRWTPPCCLRVLRETVHHVFKVLKTWNVTFWLEGGSLLGAMRMKNIIPWDYDVDIGIYLEDIDKCPWLRMAHEKKFEKKQLPSMIDNEGYVWERASPEEGDFYRVQASIHNRLHIDIFPFYVKDGIMTKKTWFPNHPQDMEFPEHYLKPLTTIEFAGVEAPAPNNVKEFLELKFGKGCVENPQYPNAKLFTFPEDAKQLVVNESYNYDFNINPS